ncbi:MAG: hypothetical protein KatS3mg076_2045 [Candidatus Binatia bacterium]|nr:MAG: hypothetical protein KatS3mg076_2045 [Candidatus Binatia bacterium]
MAGAETGLGLFAGARARAVGALFWLPVPLGKKPGPERDLSAQPRKARTFSTKTSGFSNGSRCPHSRTISSFAPGMSSAYLRP